MAGKGKQNGGKSGADAQRAAFDPYYQWLGIPTDEQPVNHYRLLGVRKYEDDPRVIESAADRQMNHVRTFQLSEYKEESQRLLNELAAARVCLLNANKKQQYDEQLTEDDAAALDDPDDDIAPATPERRNPTTQSSPNVRGMGVPIDLPIDTGPATRISYPRSYQRHAPTVRRRYGKQGIDWKQPRWIAAIVCGAIAIIVLFILLLSVVRNRPPKEQPPSPANGSPQDRAQFMDAEAATAARL